MNDIIDLLALQATDHKGGLDRHKFANLIVGECIQCCDDVDAIQKHYLKYYIDQELGAAECIEVIKRHFGVE